MLAYLNIGAVAFVLVCLLDTLKGDAGINLAMSFGAVFTVMTTGITLYRVSYPIIHRGFSA